MLFINIHIIIIIIIIIMFAEACAWSEPQGRAESAGLLQSGCSEAYAQSPY